MAKRKGGNLGQLLVCGRTKDGRNVVTGWFPLVDSEGIPLELILSHFHHRKIVPNWPDFIDVCLERGWSVAPLRTKIETAVNDVHGPKFTREVMLRFDEHMRARKTAAEIVTHELTAPKGSRKL